jgi:hypothetical protein
MLMADLRFCRAWAGSNLMSTGFGALTLGALVTFGGLLTAAEPGSCISGATAWLAPEEFFNTETMGHHPFEKSSEKTRK